MYYPRFTKAIIHHFITKDKSILMRKMFMHTAQDDSILVSPKMKRKVKRPNSLTNKRNLVTVEEEEPEPAKKVVPTKKLATKIQSSGVQIRDTLGASVSKKKAPATVLKRSERETTIHQVGGLSEGADFESKVLDEPKGKSINTSEGTGLKPRVPDVSKGDSFESEYEIMR
ncbi:hypothetical protein Tco_0041965 [Tanacetum coccineum]